MKSAERVTFSARATRFREAFAREAEPRLVHRCSKAALFVTSGDVDAEGRTGRDGRALAKKAWPSVASESVLPQYHLEEVERTSPERRLAIDYSDGHAPDE